MGIFQRYINQQKLIFHTCQADSGRCGSSVFVVIPCYNEPDIVTTLDSLAACYPPVAPVSVLIVVNDGADSPEEAVEQNNSTLSSLAKWQTDHTDLFFDVQRIVAHRLPQKWAGVGWARKIGMDEAIRQLAEHDYPDGIIVSFDADSTVSPDYLQSIESAFELNPSCNFFTIYFEHPLNHPQLSAKIREGIIRYELHMRYYRNALKWSGYPHAIHTVGSCFAVKASAYVKQGGMNRRKAGEDFYFLHKLVQLGQYGNICTTTVYPASRSSDRVPFGTGAAMKKWIEGGPELKFTYAPEPFNQLKPFLNSASRFWEIDENEIHTSLMQLHPSLRLWCENSGIVDELVELKKNCSGLKVFERRFFHLVNAFWILKYLNFAHENYFSQVDLQSAAIHLLHLLKIETNETGSVENLLMIYRNLDRSEGI